MTYGLVQSGIEPDVEKFKQMLLKKSDSEIAEEIVLSAEAKHVSQEDIEYIRKRLSEVFRTQISDISVYIVGSAKLGFSISEKRKPGGEYLPRFRPFGPESDIDVAVVSPPIFDAIWTSTSRYAYTVTPRLPWRPGDLGNYLIHGWFRPDKFPAGTRIRPRDLWWDLFRSLSSDPRFRRHQVRGALYYSTEALLMYQERSVAECRKGLELG